MDVGQDEEKLMIEISLIKAQYLFVCIIIEDIVQRRSLVICRAVI